VSTFEEWIGRERVAEDMLTLERARKLAATLDLDPDTLQDEGPLPRGWHWIYFHQAAPRSALAEDGHERRGDFLPPIPLTRRMWAGGRLRFTRALRIGAKIRRVSTIRSIEMKEGRSGPLAFVTVEHRLSDADGVLLEEEQDLVYLNPAPAPDAPAHRSPTPDSPAPDSTETVTLDEVALFRFSALTFNGHRIHFDRRYTVEVEHYPDIVVHGPLLALLLLGVGSRWADEHAARTAAEGALSFRYRAVQPAFCNEAIDLCAAAVPASGSEQGSEAAVDLWAAHPTRGVLTRAAMVIGG
jgi:3-methylfumaryl-CoA hydratase